MDLKILYLILLSALTNVAFTFESTGSRGRVKRAVWNNGREDHKFNKGYSSPSVVKSGRDKREAHWGHDDDEKTINDHKYEHDYHYDHGSPLNNDHYGGYYSVRYVHSHKEKDKTKHGCKYGDCNYDGYHFDDGFEYKYGDDDEDGHRGYNEEYNFDHDHHNDDINDYGPHHYAYPQSHSNYDKDYSGYVGDYYYSHREPHHFVFSHNY
ncbi:histidine-rich glycoprotein-like [Ceratina calcarata]|uniref:Histidine-rich glycoprotein-like n=1 Tax=Ceratina calcarata TaxID=156304 RepID=A0AAJ7S1P6_9HYME|nr:histidine-rich glycoprotein-like [Ceratina calcarata]